MRSYRFTVVRVFIFILALEGIAVAQTSSGTIRGHIVDQTGAIVVNAEVRLINQQTAVKVTTNVRSNGDFIFADIQPRNV